MANIRCDNCGAAFPVVPEAGNFCMHCGTAWVPAQSSEVPSPAACEIDRCGVAAIGRCTRCGRAFCATHQGRDGLIGTGEAYTDRCGPCVGDAYRSKYQAKEREAQVASERIDAIDDPLERTVAAVAMFGKWEADYRNPGYRIDRAPLRDILRRLYPAWDGINHPPPWDGTTLAEWFARTANARAVPIDGRAECATWTRSLFGRVRPNTAHKPAWILTTRPGGDGERPFECVFEDGTWCPSPANDPPDFPGQYRNFTAKAVRSMGYRLGYHDTLDVQR